jgi:hypothetical protein
MQHKDIAELLRERSLAQAEIRKPGNALRIERREQKEHRQGRSPIKHQLFYIFLCKKCNIKEIKYPCYYFSNIEKYKNMMTYQCRRCCMGLAWRRKRRPFESVFNTLVSVARRKHHDCKLSYEQFLEFTTVHRCEYCTRPIKWKSRGGTKAGHHLDRKDNSQGYSHGNCVVCCGECNRIKGSIYTYEQMRIIGRALALVRRSSDESFEG